MERNPGYRILCSLQYFIKARSKLRNAQCYTPSSGPFRTDECHATFIQECPPASFTLKMSTVKYPETDPQDNTKLKLNKNVVSSVMNELSHFLFLWGAFCCVKLPHFPNMAAIAI
jgi:hypothetical protein